MYRSIQHGSRRRTASPAVNRGGMPRRLFAFVGHSWLPGRRDIPAPRSTARNSEPLAGHFRDETPPTPQERLVASCPPPPACYALTRTLSYPYILWLQPDYLPNIELFRPVSFKSGTPHRLTVTKDLHQNASPEADPTCRDKFSTTPPSRPPGGQICASPSCRLD